MTPEYCDDTKKRGRGRPPKDGKSARSDAQRAWNYRFNKKLKQQSIEHFLKAVADVLYSESDMSPAHRLARIQDRFEGYMPMAEYDHLIPPARRSNNPT